MDKHLQKIIDDIRLETNCDTIVTECGNGASVTICNQHRDMVTIFYVEDVHLVQFLLLAFLEGMCEVLQ